MSGLTDCTWMNTSYRNRRGIKNKLNYNCQVSCFAPVCVLQSFCKQPTIRAVVIHHNDLLQQVFRCAIDDAPHGSFEDRQGFIQVD